jgi:hypothetical protein
VAVGLVLGAAAALKWTAWPLLPVALALLAVTAGRRAVLRATVTALLPAAVAVLPLALAEPRTFAEHVLLFPLGAGGAGSPAASPLPGHLLATLVPGGALLAVAALAVSAVAVGVSVVVRPPRNTVAAADRLALGLALAMCLMPATRFGYVVYPLVLLVWFRLATAGRRPVTAPAVLPSGAAMPTRLSRPSRLARTTRGADASDVSRTSGVSPAPDASRTSRPTRRPASLTYSVLRALSRRFSFGEDEIDGLHQVVREGDVCLDIGAEYGLYTYALAGAAGPRGQRLALAVTGEVDLRGQPTAGPADRLTRPRPPFRAPDACW